ncbi:MAG: 16S rRNA processing protein RimM [Raoultibacter sp.]
MSAWAVVAKLVKAKTLEGGLVVRPAHGLPFLLQEGMSVVFVPPVLKTPKGARVGEITALKEDSRLVYFDGVDTIGEAETLVGRFCLVNKGDLPLNYAVHPVQWWAGFAVYDASRGFLGTVSEVVENPAQHLLCIRNDEGEIMIPFVDEFVRSVDETEARIDVDVPQSLLDLAKD